MPVMMMVIVVVVVLVVLVAFVELEVHIDVTNIAIPAAEGVPDLKRDDGTVARNDLDW